MRRIVMRPRSASALVVALGLALSGCGNDGLDEHLNDLPKTGAAACLSDEQVGSSPILVTADLEGDGQAEPVQYGSGSGGCSSVLFARVDGERRGVQVDDALPVTAAATQVITMPGRTGQLVLLRQEHPRGGFQARLFGYAGGKLEELSVDGKPIFGFIATDSDGEPTSASCTANGFEVTRAVAHQPVGVAFAWDLKRTTYSVQGNEVTAGATTEIGDNLLPGQLEKRHPELLGHELFRNCLDSGT
jgi:hypothetical protein